MSDEEDLSESLQLLKDTPSIQVVSRRECALDVRTYLAIANSEIPADVPPLDNPTTVALNRCRENVVKPYQRLLKVVGWHPLRMSETPINSCINYCHVVFCILIILVGYLIQYAACFKRERGVVIPDKVEGNGTYIDCSSHIISQYIIPDILHSAAYMYGFYILRIAQSEYLHVLMETVFLDTSPNQSGYQSQNKLVIRLRMMLYGGLVWVLTSTSSQLLHVIAEFDNITFTWMSPGSKTVKVVLVCCMLVSFIALDMVYLSVVISYGVQCELLIYYLKGLRQRILERALQLEDSIKTIGQTEKHIKDLNDTMASAVSLVLFNFITMAILGTATIMDKKRNNELTPLMYVSTGFSVLLWVGIMAVPLIQASRLSGASNSTRKLGHEVRLRPFGFRATPQLDLDSFLHFTSTLNMRAKLFRIPIRSSYIMLITIGLCLGLLLAFQLGYIKVWL